MTTQYQHDDHTTRRHYGGLAAALSDALRVQRDLIAAIENPDALFPDPDELSFLARRSAALISAAHRTAIGQA